MCYNIKTFQLAMIWLIICIKQKLTAQKHPQLGKTKFKLLTAGEDWALLSGGVSDLLNFGVVDSVGLCC